MCNVSLLFVTTEDLYKLWETSSKSEKSLGKPEFFSGKPEFLKTSGEKIWIPGKPFPEFRNKKRQGTFRKKFVFFYKTALGEVHIIKISVKLVEICVFREKIRKSPGRSGKSEIPGKKAFFSGFRTTQRQPISGKSGISGKIGLRKFPENPRKSGKIRNRKISEKVPKRRFWKIQPSFAERFKTHILRS
jgi:hypothetical protein